MITENMIRYYADRPVEFVRHLIGAEPDDIQCSILNAVAENKMTSVRSGHGIGKTTTISWLVDWFLMTRPHAIVPCTAPTQPTLRDVLWKELSKWIQHSPFLREHLVWTSEKVFVKGHASDWYAVARTAVKPEALQGFHGQYLLFVIDEASGVLDQIFEPVLGSLSTAGSKLVMAANPTQLSGFFYNSHTINRESYCCLRADGRNSKRVAPEFVEEIIRMYGEDSNVFRVRVAGEFPRGEDDVLIPLELVDNAVRLTDCPPVLSRPTTIDIAADVARYGSDKTVIGSKVDGYVTFERKVQGQDLMRTASEIAMIGERIVHEYGFENGIVPVKIDDSGLGGGVTDRLRQIQQSEPERFRWMCVIPVQFGQKLQHRYYDDSTTYMMSVVRDLLLTRDSQGRPKPVGLSLPNDRDLIMQLSTRKYHIEPNSKMRIENKERFKERAGKSPDEADCLLLLCLPTDREKAARMQQRQLRNLS